MKFSSLAAAAAFVIVPSLSHALTLECTVPESNNGGGYITETYVIQHEQGESNAIVLDGLILYYNDDQPMVAKVSGDTANKLAISWTVVMTNSTGQQTKMLFRAAYFKSTGKITVTGVPSGYSNQFEGRGKCKAV